MRTKNEKIAFIGFDIPRILTYAILTLALILAWNIMAVALVTITLIYAAYKFTRLALGGFQCAHCYFKFFVALAIFIFSIGAVTGGSAWVAIIMLWTDALMKGVKK